MNPSDAPAQLIRDSFPLSQLLEPQDLDAYAIPHELKNELKPGEDVLERTGLKIGRLSFLDADRRPIALPAPALDADWRPIALPTPGLDLCRDALSDMPFDVCATCPIRQSPPEDETPVLRHCGAGYVQRYIAAIRCGPKKQRVGYVCGPDIPTDEFYKDALKYVRKNLAEDLLQYRRSLQGLSLETVRTSVGRIARRLSRRCELERRLKILRHARKRIVGCTTQQEVLHAGFLSLQALFGDVDVCLYILTQTGTLQFVDACGPNQLSQPDTLGAHQGHIGRVIRDQKPYYAPDLIADPQGYVQPDSDFPILSAYTVPLVWGSDEKAAALQVSSSEKMDRFQKADRQSIWVLADLISLAGVRIALRQPQRTFGFADIHPANWADCLMQVIAAPTGTLVETLEAKKLLMQSFANEALLCTGAANSAVQLFDADDSLRFAVCSGPGWTEEAKAKKFKRGEVSPGMYAREHGEHFVADIQTLEPNFKPALRGTKAVYAIRFRSREPIGVISVCWSQALPLGSAPPHKKEFLGLVRQFENVLDALDSRERDIQRRLVATLASRPTLNSEELAGFAKETVNQTKTAFGVRGCSMFLVFPGQDVARLMATTSILPARPIWYEPGEGLTGWVLKTGRCLRLKDATDEKELEKIDPDLKSVKKWIEDIEYRDAQGKRRFLAAPMLCQGKVVGIIRLTIKENLQDFTPEEETRLAQIARELAETIFAVWKQAETEERLAATAKEIQQLHQIGLGFAEARDADTLIQQVLAAAITESRMKWGMVRLLNMTTNHLELRERQGTPPAALPLTLPSNPVLERALNSVRSVYIPDTSVDSLWAALIASLPEGPRRSYLQSVHTVVHVPIRLRERTIGLILLESPEPVEVPGRTLHFLDMLGGYAAVAIELAETKKRAETVVAAWEQAKNEEEVATANEIQQLHRIGLGFAEAPDADTLIQQVLAAAITESGMRWGIVRLQNATTHQLELREFQGPPPAALPLTLPLNPVMERALNSEGSFYIPDTSADPLWTALIASLPQGPRRSYLQGVRTVIHVPIRLRRRTIGLILLESPDVIEVPNRVLHILNMLGGYTAVALELAETRKRTLSMLGDIIGGYAHEIRHRSKGISAKSGRIPALVGDRKRVEDKVAAIRQEIRFLELVSHDLSLFAQEGSGTDMKLVTLATVITSAIADYRRSSKELDIRPDIRISPEVKARPVLLRTALIRIIENADEAMSGRGLITIRLESVKGAPCITVEDNGPGMDEKTVNRCLEPGFSTKPQTQKRLRGLGLAAVYGIMRFHGGRIQVESEKGRGTKVTLVFASDGSQK